MAGGWRTRILDAASALVATALLAALAYRAWRETGSTNSYALLADAFRHGRLDVLACFDIDCVTRDGLTYVIFPPVPGVLALPFVAGLGVGFAGFTLIGLALAGAAAWCWWRIARKADTGADTRLWFLAAVFLGSPVFYLLTRADRIWFFAQIVAFTLVSAALWAALTRRSALLAGTFLGLAFLSRQMTLLAVPAVALFLMRPDEPLLRLSRERLALFARLAAPVAAALAVYLVYNQVRFGHPLDTGYGLLTLRNSGSVMDNRLSQDGTFHASYVLQNLFYLLFQGFHAEFSGPKLTQLAGLDPFGSALPAASPWLFALALIRFDRRAAGALLVCLAIAGITLFYSPTRGKPSPHGAKTGERQYRFKGLDISSAWPAGAVT